MTRQDTLSEEILALARERALDLAQPLCRITEACDRAAELADELFRIACHALILAQDLRETSVSVDEHVSRLNELLGNEEADR